MCRALKVLCAASGRDRLVELKKATVSTNWELVGGVPSLGELAGQVESWRPDVVVIDESLGADAINAVRSVMDRVRVVIVGAPVEGADETAASFEEVRAAVLGLPKPGGPVR
jgi:chemotaxis response regulator CheB